MDLMRDGSCLPPPINIHSIRIPTPGKQLNPRRNAAPLHGNIFSFFHESEQVYYNKDLTSLSLIFRCDRILWHGNGIEQLSYIRGESRFSDHRPVCAVFSVEVELRNENINRFRKGYSCAGKRMEFEEDSCMPPSHCLYEF